MKKYISLFLIIITLLSVLPLQAGAAAEHRSCISLVNVKSNKSGAGYKWDNYSSTLTLDGLNINTDDEFGLKIMDGATVILKGDNYIKASDAAVFLAGKVLFKGEGSLTLVSKNGIFCSSADATDSLAIVGGTYKITSTEEGIVSEFHKVSLSNSRITVDTENGIAIRADVITTSAKTVIKANGSMIGKTKLRIEASSIELTTSDKALVSDNPITFAKVKLKGGDALDKLSDIDLEKGYGGEMCLKTVSTYDGGKKSIIFGGNVPIYVDVIVLVFGLACLGCVTVLPIVYKKKKAKAAIAKRDEAQAELEANRKKKS